jgi:hypothetical protein
LHACPDCDGICEQKQCWSYYVDWEDLDFCFENIGRCISLERLHPLIDLWCLSIRLKVEFDDYLRPILGA